MRIKFISCVIRCRIVSHSLHSLSAFALFMTVGSFTHGIQYSFIPLFHFLLAASFNKFHSGFKHLFFASVILVLFKYLQQEINLMKQPQFSQHFNNQLLEQPTCGNKLNAAGIKPNLINQNQISQVHNKITN